MFQTDAVEKIIAHILCLITFLNLTVHEIMWKNTVDTGRPQHTLHMLDTQGYRHTHTHTHSECVTRIIFLLQQLLHERASMLRFIYVACLVNVKPDGK